MDTLVLLSSIFFILGVFAPIYYLLRNKRRKQTLEEITKESLEQNPLVNVYDNWIKQGKTVHPIKFVNGGISSWEVKALPKGIHPIVHNINIKKIKY